MSDDEGGCGGFDDLGGDDRELVDAQDAVDLDEEALKVGTRAMLQLVLDHQRGTGG